MMVISLNCELDVILKLRPECELSRAHSSGHIPLSLIVIDWLEALRDCVVRDFCYQRQCCQMKC